MAGRHWRRMRWRRGHAGHAPDRADNSRLSCQIEVGDGDGMVVACPNSRCNPPGRWQMNIAEKPPDASTLALSEEIDVSDPRLLEQDAWRPYFARLRAEDPVHYVADSAFGPFWSITRFDDIVAVDSDPRPSRRSHYRHRRPGRRDPLRNVYRHGPAQAMTYSGGRCSRWWRRKPGGHGGADPPRVVDILEGLPVGETFDWVERVSINLTTQMLATLFDFPFEQRHKLTYWSDIAAGSPEIAGGDVSHEERVAGLQECLETFTRIWHERKGGGRST